MQEIHICSKQVIGKEDFTELGSLVSRPNVTIWHQLPTTNTIGIYIRPSHSLSVFLAMYDSWLLVAHVNKPRRRRVEERRKKLKH